MTRITMLLSEGFADWEGALLAATARSWYGVEVKHATLDGLPVTSAGGMRVMPQAAIVDALADADALIVIGGLAWRSPEAPDVTAVLQGFGGVVAGICDGTRELARAAILDGVAHTSNDLATLDEVSGYAGQSRFVVSGAAVRDGRVVTAPGTAPVSFMAEVMAALGLADDNLRFYRGLMAKEHAALEGTA